MKRELVTWQVGGEAFDALVVRPSGGDGPRPVVLICHAWAGRDAVMEQRAEAIAGLGYVAAAVDVYGVGKRGSDAASCQALMMPLVNDPPRLRQRLQAAFEVVRALPGVDASRMAATGYCFGGLCAILLARMGLPLRGVVSFHGLLKLGEKLETKPTGRLLVLHGQDDPMVPPSDVGAFAEEMKRLDATWYLESYAGVTHAFTNPAARDGAGGMQYDAAADARSWLAATRFLGDVFEG